MRNLGFSLFLFFFFLSILMFSAFSAVSWAEEFPARTAYKKSTRSLSKPLIGDDGRIYACSGNNLFSFETNGSIAWSVHLNFKCNTDIAPVYAGTDKIFLVAENRILRVNFKRDGEFYQSEPEVFFDPGEAILGFAVSTLSLSVYITVKNRGLYAYNMLRQQLWIAEPKFERFGYRLGCRKDVLDCSFNSRPVIDACEASIYWFYSGHGRVHVILVDFGPVLESDSDRDFQKRYMISNTEGELYSLSLRVPHFNWIQDFSSVDGLFTITPGNNGLLYVIFPVKSLIVALDTFSGHIQWQENVGPLPASSCDPVVDSNGWISIGSLDGSLYSFSPTGKLKKFPKHTNAGSVIQVDPFLDCSGNAVYVSQTKMEGKINRVIGEYTYVSANKPESTVFTLLVPEIGSVYWSQSYPDQIPVLLSSKDMQHFVLDERIVLVFIAASKTGNPLQCRSQHERLASSCSLAQPEHLEIYIGNERAIIWFLLFESVVLILLVGLVRFCFVFWKKKKLQGQSLGNFLEKRRSLQQKKKEFDRTITELQKKAADGEMIEKIGDLVRERENVERKLSSTYSLGRDGQGSKPKSKSNGSILPMHDGDSRSFSFRSTETESVTIFRSLSDQSSSGESSGGRDDDTTSIDDDQEEGYLANKLKGKFLIDSAGSDDDVNDYDDNDDADDDAWSMPSTSRSKCLKRRTLSSTI